MKTHKVFLAAVSAVLTVSSATALQTTETSTSPDRVMGVPRAQLAPAYSGTVGEVVKLSDSGVDQSVVLAYVKNSPQPFNPSADDIIKLRNAGITSEVITAMLQRSGELRQQAASAPAGAPAPYQPVAPGYAYSAPAESAPVYSAPAESAPASTVYYLSSGYPTYYPSYASAVYYGYPSYSYGYGGCYYPRYYSSYCSYPRYSSYCYPGYSRYCSYPGYSRNCSVNASFAVGATFRSGNFAGSVNVRSGGGNFAGATVRSGGFNGGTMRSGGFNGGTVRSGGFTGGTPVRAMGSTPVRAAGMGGGFTRSAMGGSSMGGMRHR